MNPTGGAAPASLIVSVNPAGLLAGTYTSVILLATSTGATGTFQNIAVTLTVSTTPPPPVTIPIPVITSLVNGASMLVTPLAPGGIISIFGRGLGPTDSAAFLLTAAGLVDKLLVFVAPVLGGDGPVFIGPLNSPVELSGLTARRVGGDVLLEAYVG